MAKKAPKPPRESQGYFIVEPDGLVYVWTCNYYRRDCIGNFMKNHFQDYADWHHYRAQGFRCIKCRIAPLESTR